MCLDWRNQSENEYTTESSLHIQCNRFPFMKGTFHRSRTNFLQLAWKYRRTWIAKAVLKKKCWAGGIRHHDFKLYYRATLIETVWYWQKNRNIDQWNRIESPQINSCTYGHLIFNKWCKNIQWRKESLFNKWCWENWKASCYRMKVEHFLTPCRKVNSKWIKDLYISPRTTKLIGRTRFDINHSKIFCDPHPRVTKINTKIKKWGLI